MTTSGWIGGTWMELWLNHHGWKGMEDIGKPTPAMVNRVFDWLYQGIAVKIFTARAGIPEQIPFIKNG